MGCNTVIALIVVKAEGGVGVESIEAVVLQLICPHLVGETKPAAFLRQIENDAAAEIFEQRHSEPKLVAAVAAPRAEHVAGQAGGMQPHRNGICEIRLPDDDGDLTATHGVTEHDKAGGRA
jgi:hypothetical protein